MDHRKKQDISRKTCTSALLTTPNPLTVWITTNWKILQEMGIPDHLYAGQEATVRTVLGTTDWFQIRKGVCQGCILSHCLFNLYAKCWADEAKLESRLPGKVSITSDTHMTSPLWQKGKKN